MKNQQNKIVAAQMANGTQIVKKRSSTTKNVLDKNNPCVDNTEIDWAGMAKKYSQYVDYVKTYELENHLMTWFETNAKGIDAPDLVTDIIQYVVDWLECNPTETGEKPFPSKMLSENSEDYDY